MRLVIGMDEQIVSKHYDASYFQWQRTVGEFGGVANSFKFKNSIRRGDTVLDFGCGGGFLLKNLDCAVRLGIEINNSAHAQIIENEVLPFSSASQIIEQRGTECVDVIISNHALEHTLDPLGELQSLLPLLKKGAKSISSFPVIMRPSSGNRATEISIYTAGVR